MSAKPPKKPEKPGTKGRKTKAAPPQDIADAPPVPEMKIEPPHMPETPMLDAPHPENQAPPTPEPLTEREKHLVSVTTQQVLNQIDPLLIKLKQISNEAVSMGAQQKVQELERGINDRIESRINKINAIIGRKNR